MNKGVATKLQILREETGKGKVIDNGSGDIVKRLVNMGMSAR